MRGYHVARTFAFNGRDRIFSAMASDALFPTDGYREVSNFEVDVEDPRGSRGGGGKKKALIRGCLRTSALLLLLTAGTLCLNYVLNPYVCTPFASSRAPLVPLMVHDPPTSATPRLVALLGDSMVIDPEWQHYGLQVGLQQRLPNYNLTIVNLGRNAAQMRHARIDVDRWLFNTSLLPRRPFPDAVVLSTDSDISDMDFDALARTGTYDAVKAQYTADLEYVVNVTVRRHGAFMVLTSPGAIFTEGWFLAPDTLRFHNKKRAFADYNAVNRDVAQRWGITYVDLRSLYAAAIPWWRLAYSGCVTRDGEHSNQRGTDILATALAAALNQGLALAGKSKRTNNAIS